MTDRHPISERLHATVQQLVDALGLRGPGTETKIAESDAAKYISKIFRELRGVLIHAHNTASFPDFDVCRVAAGMAAHLGVPDGQTKLLDAIGAERVLFSEEISESRARLGMGTALYQDGDGELLVRELPEIPNIFDSYGSAEWAPVRDKNGDFSRWGRWEAWRHFRIGELPGGAIGPIPTGSWVAWDSATGQQIGFDDKSVMTAKEQAIMMCRVQNGELIPPEDMHAVPVDQWQIAVHVTPTRVVE